VLDNSSTLLLARQDPTRRGSSKNIPDEIFSQQVERGAGKVSPNMPDEIHSSKKPKKNRAVNRGKEQCRIFV